MKLSYPKLLMELPAEQPVLYTSRLVLRPFGLADVAAVVALAGDRAVAEYTLSIPGVA